MNGKCKSPTLKVQKAPLEASMPGVDSRKLSDVLCKSFKERIKFEFGFGQKGLRKQTNLQRGNHGGRWIDPQTDDETKTTILQKRMRRATQGQEWSQYQAGEWIRRSLLQGRTAPEDRKLSGFADRRCSPRLVCSPPSSRSKDEGGRRGPGWSRGEVGAL